ncbi:hypothetical protein BVI1335_280030 [Burkholderia vietnamiensis]|nr:hypothetical protein BVI1335_280030 [Burkholderia vietnamiensis]
MRRANVCHSILPIFPGPKCASSHKQPMQTIDFTLLLCANIRPPALYKNNSSYFRIGC